MVRVDFLQFRADCIEERTTPYDVIRDLPTLIAMCTHYVDDMPNHENGLCSWMQDEGLATAYEVIAILRKQRMLVVEYGTGSYVDEVDGFTAVRHGFASDLRDVARAILESKSVSWFL